MVREIVFDTETTGFNPESGEKLVEIGAIELINHVATGVTYHQYINPKKEVPEDAFRIHGLSYDFLKSYPIFADIADDFMEFIGDATLVAHNARFDIDFLNYELKQINKPQIFYDRVVDTLEIAKVLFPGARNNLDALCKRFEVDNTNRVLHGALLDAQLLGEVYLELLGGREPSLILDNKKDKKSKNNIDFSSINVSNYREPRIFAVTDEEISSHNEFLEKKVKGALWLINNSSN